MSPELMVASLVPHVLFALFLWGLGRWLFRGAAGRFSQPGYGKVPS